MTIFERGPSTNGWEPIDTSETSFFVHPGTNFDLEMVFVLDFTASMAQTRLPDGRSGIQVMVDTFIESMDRVSVAHRIGLVEFHDRNFPPFVLSELTLDREALKKKAGDFAAGAGKSYEPGASEVRTALVAALPLFSSQAQNPYTTRVLVFLSDGKDRSSPTPWLNIATLANNRGVQIYALGVGNVLESDLKQIKEVTGSTKGFYYSAENIELIQIRLRELIRDLSGQYVVSYTTLRSVGSYEVRFEVNIGGIVGTLIASIGDVSKFKGNDLLGRITFDPPTIDLAQHKATLFMRALHIPRGITKLRFRLDTQKPIQLAIVKKEDGGLLDGWTLTGPDNGYYTVETTPDRPLAFGNFGPLFKIEADDVTEPGLAIPLLFDSTIYGQTGKSFASVAPPQPTGTPTPTPTPTPTRTPTPTPTPTPGPVQMGLNDVMFSGASQSGPQIAVPQGKLVKVFANELTGSSFVHYYVQVRWNGALIYDPTDPEKRPFVETIA